MALGHNIGRELTLLGSGALATTTGTTLSCSPIVDLTGYDGFLALCNPNVTATNNGLAAQVGSATNAMSDLAGTWTTAHTTALMLEVFRPGGGPYYNVQLRQGTSGRHGPIYFFGIGTKKLPTTGNTFSSCTYKFVNSPVSGTATSS